jgi:hypothetical protein
LIAGRQRNLFEGFFAFLFAQADLHLNKLLADEKTAWISWTGTDPFNSSAGIQYLSQRTFCGVSTRKAIDAHA